MTFLIVEANPGMRRVVRLILGTLATRVYEYTEGADARTAYEASRPDFVLMDISTGRVDGLAATREILATDGNARVIVLADDDQPDLREAAIAAGACGYVLKDNLLELLSFFQSANS